MRFRRRVKIMKGLSLNLSKSGVSLSTGVRGASVTIGKKGSYLNTGIPGTGLSNRTKIGDTSSSQQRYNRNAQIPDENVKVAIGLDDKGSPTLTITDSSGRQIIDETILRRVKKSERYNQSVNELVGKRKVELDDETNKFINISKFTPDVFIESIIQDELKNLLPQIYTPKKYSVEIPNRELISSNLAIEAKEKIKKILFWKNKKLREDYVSENIVQSLQEKIGEWTVAKNQLIEIETENKVVKDKEYLDEYLFQKESLEKILEGSLNYVNEKIEAILTDIVLPVEFSVSYDYHPEYNQLKIDLDLPEIENMPQAKANILSSGKISIKQKTQKELKHEYAHCVSGLAFYIGGIFFNISTNIKEILISGYTQRMNKANGSVEDQYIYSLKLSRDKFSTLNFENIDAIEAFSNFENQRSISASYDFKTINPW